MRCWFFIGMLVFLFASNHLETQELPNIPVLDLENAPYYSLIGVQPFVVDDSNSFAGIYFLDERTRKVNIFIYHQFNHYLISSIMCDSLAHFYYPHRTKLSDNERGAQKGYMLVDSVMFVFQKSQSRDARFIDVSFDPFTIESVMGYFRVNLKKEDMEASDEDSIKLFLIAPVKVKKINLIVFYLITPENKRKNFFCDYILAYDGDTGKYKGSVQREGDDYFYYSPQKKFRIPLKEKELIIEE